ncbi:efflux RND transporter periplasmic adaptor subunit [Vagococcus sp. BWB3-3]|uniref:Efflux RND transporter periplasmic adaptor subunit n=1 Tax=Vagococcus allomyrinae TaxID=2794353 RepID=A0A940PBQ5_9ENTE|nr:biotin/lipoyl-binding protein [Vagococcus allomyrinae]MBP1041830.1 efflux RND transporter periplasmic adaptor subunit [Vagococcus allomyrinae]
MAKQKKKLTKKQKIRLSIVGGVIALIAIAVAAIIGSQGTEESADRYSIYKLKESEPLLFKGTVDAENVESIYYDQSLGKISSIAVTDGKEVKKDDVLLSYQNDVVQTDVSQQERLLNKSSLAVSTAQENLNSAIAKKNELTAKVNQAASDYNKRDEATAEGAAQAQEDKATYEQNKQALEAQEDVIRQANQALEAANLDLNDSAGALDDAKGKVTVTVKAPTDGIAYVDEKGKTDMTTPVVKIVSPKVVINGVVSEYDYQKISVNQDVEIRPVSSNDVVKGNITYVDKLPLTKTAGDTSSMINFEFKVVPEKELQYGYNVQIALNQKELRIPEKAVIKEGEVEKVFVYRKGKAIKQVVKTVNQDGFIVVQEGLAVGDTVINDPTDTLKDGEEVAVKQ